MQRFAVTGANNVNAAFAAVMEKLSAPLLHGSYGRQCANGKPSKTANERWTTDAISDESRAALVTVQLTKSTNVTQLWHVI